MDLLQYTLEQSHGVFTFKNENTTIGFVRFNHKGEVEYISLIQFLENKG